jgi:ubiquinone/menaquinone biosynthesis C-methylase UbiE
MISRFAQSHEIFSDAFASINERLLEITNQNNLIDHREVNQQRFSDWFSKIRCEKSFYGARFWEYPFAILAGDLKSGMTCADIGCGTTPFTAYLCEIAGKNNVTGYDPDYIAEDTAERHLSFGARKSHIEKFGFHFVQNNFTQLDCPDNFFDRVFCISVLEHIDDPEIKAKGLQEMARILKPGGKLIMTFDTGLEMTFNPPLKIIELTGLVPDDTLDLRWPEKRFVDYGSSNIDVFGLVLEKPTGEIYLDYKATKKIPAYTAAKKYVDASNWFNVSYTSVLMMNDLKRPWGTIRFLLKRLLNKY